jgi:hypothetical protein
MKNYNGKDYLDSIFMSRGWDDPSNPFNFIGRMGIKKEDFIGELNALQADERGFINLDFTPQRADPKKFSVSVNNFKPQKKAGGAPYKAPLQKTSVPSSAAPDDLPF